MENNMEDKNFEGIKTEIKPLHPYLSKLISFEGKEGQMPLSPHLTIYQTQLSSISSISYRFAGLFLLIGTFVFFAFEFFWDLFVFYRSFFSFFNSDNDFIGAAIFFFCLLFSYHIVNGLRHVVFDLGRFVT